MEQRLWHYEFCKIGISTKHIKEFGDFVEELGEIAISTNKKKSLGIFDISTNHIRELGEFVISTNRTKEHSEFVVSTT